MAILTKDLKKLGKAAFFWIALVFFYHQYVLLQPTASQESELVHQESAQLTRSHSINDEWRDFWKWTQSSSSAHHLYSADFDWAAVNKGLATANIQKVYSFSSDDDELGDIFPKLKSSDFGSAYKWILVLDGGQIAIFKPQWYPRNYTREFWFDGHELHTGEIASFHLDRILGFRRVPFTSGRKIHLKSELIPVASKHLLSTIFNRGAEVCLTAQCYFCPSVTTTCSYNGFLEGAVLLYVTGLSPALQNPFGVKSIQEGKAPKTCDSLLLSSPSEGQGSLLPAAQLSDLAVLDFLSLHFDSKLYLSSEGSLVYVDRGRAFTRHDSDDEMNLIALKQCCRLSQDTVSRLHWLNSGEELKSQLMAALDSDPVGSSPILTSQHYAAMERRLSMLLDIYSSHC